MTRRTYATPQREALARTILGASPDLPHATLARQLGMAPEAVRRVRVGLLWASAAPDLPRISNDQLTRTCRTCRLFDHAPYRLKTNGQDLSCYGSCSLDYPEARHNHHWARSCEAYAHDPTTDMPSPAPAMPRPDAFRLGDTWRGPDGRSYTCCRGPAAHTIILQPAGLSAPLTLRRNHVEGFQRIAWGGEW